MINKFILTIFVIAAFYATNAYAVEKAERITDKEIIERLTRVEEGQKLLDKRIDDLSRHLDKRFDDINRRFDDMNKRFDDLMRYMQILTAAIIGVIGWQVVMWRKLIRIEERQKRFETQDDEIKFLKDAYNKLNEMILKLMDTLKHQAKT
jgi:hypothetical protein